MSEPRALGPETWVDEHGDCLYRYALLRLRSADLAADLVQETFLEALRSWGQFAGRSSERTWLVGILKHKIIDHFRRVSRQADRVSDPGARSDVTSIDFDRRGHWRSGPGSWAGEPSHDLETREFWNVFSQCLAKLPPGLAEAFFLRELDGLSSEDVQERLGITAVNLWTRLHRSRSLLRHCLEVGWFVDNRPRALLKTTK